MRTDTQAVTAYLGLGSNLGSRLENLRAAVRALAEHPDIDVDLQRDLASLYETRPVGGPKGQDDYLNSCLRVTTVVPPHDLLTAMPSIETDLGRVRQGRDQPRPIDLDLLLYGTTVIREDTLSLPHPRLPERRFVLEPLAELCGNLVHPTLGLSIAELRRRREDDDNQGVRCVAGRDWHLEDAPGPG